MCCPHADSLARSPVHSCPLVFVRSSCARFGCARHLSAVIPPAMAGTQDSAPGPAPSAGREGEARRATWREKTRTVRSRRGSRSGLRPMHVCHEGCRGARGKGYGEESADGVGNCARASQPLANERASERASELSDEPAPLEQLPFSSFRVVFDIPFGLRSFRGVHR